VQLCLVHQVRNSLRYVTSKDQKAVVADLKPIYQSANLAGAEQKLADFTVKWEKKYPLVVESCGAARAATELVTFNALF
jgi:putative transposase